MEEKKGGGWDGDKAAGRGSGRVAVWLFEGLSEREFIVRRVSFQRRGNKYK